MDQLEAINEISEIYDTTLRDKRKHEQELILRQHDILIQKNKVLEERVEDLQLRNKMLNSHVSSLRDLLKIYVLNDSPKK
jgi:hypothetical protein